MVIVDYIHLYHPSFLKLISYSKHLGKPFSINTISGNKGPFRDDIRALWDWAPHDIAMCIKLLNEFPKVNKAKYLKRDFNYVSQGNFWK